ncbi:transcriptional regulator, MarR family [Pseudooceanicola antarcticus]|uniref:MarR family transcriptional regulator n=1 Tax=Pseudooceanicola antarcticus TaxID=1247613 RepID=A0A285J3C7_9RHOB|nr:MarR family transcriptional regulator [Pseudooceanicola antarcticus]PJE29702.1 MarR family transcriptional regulator [Pseudooceanicola antarcticus]SNY54774.1 transcriptional regulator, MarR family [Pseudooceanicola antarcticus]
MSETTQRILPPTEALICFNLYAASHGFIRLYAPYLERIGLTYPQFLVLLTLRGPEGEGQPQGVGELGALLGMESNTLSPLLKRMQGAGLLTRTRSEEDERRVVIALTEAGRARAEAAAEVPGCIAKDTGLSEEDYHTTLEVLRKLRGQIAGLDGKPATE